jgi:hypothetical protein
MKLTLLLALLLAVAIVVTINARKRRAREAKAAAAQARQRAARRNRVPEVSSNLKGVTASQTVSPYRPGESPEAGDERTA